MTWLQIYNAEISKKGGLLPFILNKERRSSGALIRRIIKKLPPKSRILEIGTGTGAIGALLSKYGFSVTGIDIDNEMVTIAKRSFALFGDPEKVFLLDAKNIVDRFGYESFDCVITHGMLEHYSDDDIFIHLENQLKISPLAICVIPMEAMTDFYKSRGFGDERYLPTSYWKKMLCKYFHLENIYGFGFKETNIRYLPEKILKLDSIAKIIAPLCAFNEFWITRKL